MAVRKFELSEYREQDGVVYITLTVLTRVGIPTYEGGNWHSTNTVFSSYWTYKDGSLLKTDGVADDAEREAVMRILEQRGKLVR